MTTLLLAVAVLLLALVLVGVYRTLVPPSHLYAYTGEFPGCPSRPSCVSSEATDEVHAIQPILLGASGEAGMARLRAAVASLPGLHSVEVQGDYLHAVFQTPTMRYRDDLELLIGDDGRTAVRSISRFGYRDFGVNRERVESLRAVLAAGAGGAS